jgi:heavy-metal-associated domain-containing protein
VSVVHQVRGRLRVRVPSTARVEGLVEAVLAMPGVRAASWSPRTRGLLVLHDEAADTESILATIARHAGVEHLAEPASAAAGGARPTLAAATSSVFGEVNARVTRATGGLLTLGALVPLALTVWAGREILRGRTAPLAWSTALWYAHGLFRDYNLPSRDD